MKRTYTRTMMIEDLTKAEVKVVVYDGSKYDASSDVEDRSFFKGLTSWDIIEGGEEAEEIEIYGRCGIDKNHEYLVLHFKDGSTKTYKNSFVDMFIR